MSDKFIHDLQDELKKCKLKWGSFAEQLVLADARWNALLH